MKHFILGILLLLSTQVWALPAPKQIQDAVHAGQFVQAEQMLREVIAAKPDSALAYYELGQVLAREQRHGDAVQALQQAQTLEPSLKFARSADLFHQILTAEQASAQQQARKPVRPVSSSTSIAHTKPLAIAQQSSPAHGVSAGLLVVIALCLIAVFVYVKRKNSREQNDRAKRLEQMADQQLSDLLRQAELVRDAELECRAATYAPEKKEFVLEAVRRHNEAIMQAITQCRDGAPIGSGAMSALTSETRRVCAAAKLGEFPPMSAQDFAEQRYSAGQGQPQPGYGAPQEPPYQNNGGYSGNQHTSGSGIGGALGGLAAGVVIGEMLGHHGSAGASERVVDVVEERDPADTDSSSSGWFDFDGSDSNADADWNNDDDSSKDSNNWGGDSDWGSSDSSDSSSFDSGDSGSDDSSW
jgi:cbb3-type cytochrome oxidase subunit 3